MSIFKNRRLDLKKYSYIDSSYIFGEMEHERCFFLYYYMNKNRYKKFAQATRVSGGVAERYYLLAKDIPNKKCTY